MARYRLPLWIVLVAAGWHWQLAASGTAASAEDRRETTVGMTARIDQLVLPGTELEVIELRDRKLPVVLRIVEVYPHGTAFRYDLVYYALEPGTFDLRDYLLRKDGSSTKDLPPLRVTVRPLLPPGQVQPHPLEISGTPWLGGYLLLLVVMAALWVVGLAAILLVGRRGRASALGQASRPLTLADRLRPLVEQALAGKLTHAQCAELERSLLAYWRRRLHLEDKNPAEAIGVMRRHPEAGPLLEQLEIWLHRPGTSDKVDVTALLRPYSCVEMPATGFEEVGETGSPSQAPGGARTTQQGSDRTAGGRAAHPR